MLQHVALTISENARRHGDKCALSDSNNHIDYKTLDFFSGELAANLNARGCAQGDRIVILAHRSALLVATFVGLFKAGCIHVPLDPRMPEERLRYILDDIAPKLVITETDMLDRLQPFTKTLLVDELQVLLDRCKAKEPKPLPPTQALSLDAIAYCIYTSGSTGRPKGVLIEHRSIAEFFDGLRLVYDVTDTSRCATFSPLHFDAFLMDMLFPLVQGASLVVYDDFVAPDAIFETLTQNHITHFSAWGTMLGLITQAEDFGRTPLPDLQTVLTGADVPDIKAVQRWLQKREGIKVINGYGPTEATCAATAHVIRALEPERSEPYPIGQPFRNVRILLVDRQGGRIEKAGVSGELLIGGAQVMRGYWNLPEESASRLITIDGTRFYRTGDICSYLRDGPLLYIGRKDDEVNIGGYRVHLNEIRRVIGAVPNVHAAEIVTINSSYGEKILAAGVLLENERATPELRQLELIHARLLAELPGYMVPRHIAILKQFPRLSSGKADRKTLAVQLQRKITPFNEEVNASEH